MARFGERAHRDRGDVVDVDRRDPRVGHRQLDRAVGEDRRNLPKVRRHELARAQMRIGHPRALEILLDRAVHPRKPERRLEFGHDPRELDHVLHAGARGGIDERLLHVFHRRVRRRDQHRPVNAAQRRGERLGTREIALDHLDVRQGRQVSGLGGVARQRPDGDAMGR